ncbi:MAG: hypothetical protein A3K59_06435 [Euryarchaeota archaeon RBG_19FT_COMBO_69_17]|nr:MAG: hypothetical protein A3K59_06435 [Euryarchaeota archaeon RBG_19FT_COMBO_69_17]
MRAYELRRGWARNVEGDKLRAIAADTFGSANVEDGKVVVSFGAIDRLTAWTDGKSLFVDIAMKAGVPDGIATDTITRNNRFLETATGYNAKERSKRLQARAKEGKF